MQRPDWPAHEPDWSTLATDWLPCTCVAAAYGIRAPPTASTASTCQAAPSGEWFDMCALRSFGCFVPCIEYCSSKRATSAKGLNQDAPFAWWLAAILQMGILKRAVALEAFQAVTGIYGKPQLSITSISKSPLKTSWRKLCSASIILRRTYKILSLSLPTILIWPEKPLSRSSLLSAT